MQFLVGVFASLAASALFWLIIQQFPSLGESFQIGGMIVVFAVCSALGFWWSQKQTDKQTSVGSHSDFQKGLDATLENAVVDGSGGPTEVFSNNKVGGKATITIKNTKIKG